MMGEIEHEWIREVKKSVFGYIGALASGMVVGAIFFYFNTQKQLENLQETVARNSVRIDMKSSQDEVRSIKEAMSKEVDRLRDDIKDVRDDNKKILEILSTKIK